MFRSERKVENAKVEDNVKTTEKIKWTEISGTVIGQILLDDWLNGRNMTKKKKNDEKSVEHLQWFELCAKLWKRSELLLLIDDREIGKVLQFSLQIFCLNKAD